MPRSPRHPPDDAAELVAGISLSHPDKPLYPDIGLTKRDLALYLERIADRIVPHLARRPLSLVRCPDGRSNQCFYQKHADPSVNSAVARVAAPEKNGDATYLSAGSASALVALVQWGVLEFHPWGSRQPRLDRPDRLIFDFDPDDGISWADVVSAVETMRARLTNLGLQSFLKTTGGKGLHVVVPIRATLDWAQAKAFTKAMADAMVKDAPSSFTATASKAKRTGKIFIDYLRNAEGATAVAPYSPRARAGAPVATPIGWDDLRTDVRFAHFNVRNIAEHLASPKADPWAGFLDVRQTIPKRALGG